MSSQFVIESSIVLAVLQREPGSERLVPYLRSGVISTTNLLEIICVLQRNNVSLQRIQDIFKQLTLKIVPLSVDHLWLTAPIYSQTRHLGLGYADCVCLGLAQFMKLPAVTLDRPWEKLELGVEIIVARSHL